jgi:HK97 family phage portal protein
VTGGYRLSSQAAARERQWGNGPSAMPVGGGQSGPAPQAYSSLDLAAEGLPEFMRGGFANGAGRAVTEKSALSNATFFRAVNLIASTIGMLPLNLHRRAGDKIEKADNHPLWRLLRIKPNSWQTPYQFKSYMQGRALLRGNAYAYKVPGVRGVQALAPLDPLRVQPILGDADFTLAYKYQPKSGQQRVFKADEIFHLRAPWSSDGICGDGLLKVAAEALGLAEVTDQAAARLLRNGAYLGGVLEHPKALSPQAALNLRAQFEERFVGPDNAGKWVVAEEGMKVAPFGATGKDAEGLAQRKHQAEEVSRYTGVPRPLLMFDETSWGSGIEQLGLFLVTYCLLPWFNAWEETIADSLLKDSERTSYYAKFNEAALLRGSLKDQANFFAKALGGPGAGGFMVPNEAREKMDMNPEDWGNTPAWTQGSADE